MSSFSRLTGGIQGENGERPPTDDVCPICFDLFDFPCKTNCGHWFCGNCILEYWMYVSAIKPCKCPLCCLPVTNLVPDMSLTVQPGEDVEELIRKVQHYNHLFAGGMYALFLKVLAFPFFIKKAVRTFMNLEAVRCILCVVRFLGWMLTLFYEIEEYGFFSSGKFGMRKIFDFIVSMMLASLLLYNIWQRWELRGLERRLAALQEQNAWADLQEREALDDLQVLANLQPQDA